MKKQITVTGFGRITDVIGNHGITVDGVDSTAALVQRLEESYPALKSMTYAMAVNKQIVSDSVALPDGASVALLPPFSGG